MKWRRTSDCSATLNGNCGTRSPSLRFAFVAPDSGRCSATRSLSTYRRHHLTSWGCSPLGMLSLQAAYPELTQLEGRASGANAQNGELILAALAEAPDSLLLDARNLGTLANGTSRAILGLCDALHRARPDRRHRPMGQRGRSGRLMRSIGDSHTGRFTTSGQSPHTPQRFAFPSPGAAPTSNRSSVSPESRSSGSSTRLRGISPIVRPTDWMLSGSTLRAKLTVCCLFPISPGIASRTASAAVRVFIGGRADCRSIPATTPDPCPRRPSSTPYWFVDRQQLSITSTSRATIDLLSRSFPRKPLLVLGDRHQPRTAKVTRLDSGNVEEETMSAAFAHAEAIIFPSFYEGFGLPIVEGLSYGRTVIARASSLVDELAAEYRGPGRLLTFSTERELIGLLNELERGASPEGRALGESRTGTRMDVGQRRRRDPPDDEGAGAERAFATDAAAHRLIPGA